jgi:outer membrane protein
MKRITGCVVFFLLLNNCLFAQDKWDLKKCVDYAIVNNISVKQQDLQVRFAQLDHELDKGLQLPTVNWGLNSGYNFGLSENPTTGVLEHRKIFSTTTGLQAGLNLFSWFSIRNQIEASELTVEANKARVTKVQDDIALNVAVAYLQILMSKEQVHIAEVQLLQTSTQLDVVRRKVNAGTLPELNAAELEAQLAVDSSGLITARATVQQYILQMKALLNLDAAAPFDVTTPPVDLIPVESLADLQPEVVYNLAIANLPQQRVNELLIQSASKIVNAARGQMYPNVSLYGNLNSRFAAFRVPTYSQVITGYQTTALRADAGGGNFLDVQSPVIAQGSQIGYFKSESLATQLSDNFGQGFGIGIQVPLWNGNRARIAWNRSKLSVMQLQLQNEQDKLKLKQDIYTAYNDATTAIEKYNASRKTVAAAEKAANYAQKRYDVNLISTYDLLNTQSRLFRARIEMLSAQFDYVFRMKLLEFYKGQGLKLQ